MSNIEVNFKKIIRGKIIFVLIIGAMIMNLNGCVNVVSDEKLAKTKLEEKYNKEFVIEKVQSRSPLEKYYTVIAYPVDDPEIMFRAYVDMDNPGCSDNYVSKCVFRKIADIIGQNMDDLNGYFYIYACPDSEDTGMNNTDMNVKEYLAKHQAGTIHVYLHYAPEKMNIDTLYKNLQNSFNGMGKVNGVIHLSITDESGLNTIQNYIESTDKLYDNYDAIVDAYYVGNLSVKEGNLMCDINELSKMLKDK